MLPNARGAETDYLEWTARKRTGLRRRFLDCGHENPGEVFYHAWCDRLSCSEACANGVHDCSKFAGAKSGTEEEEPVLPPGVMTEAQFLDYLADVVATGEPSQGSSLVSFSRPARDGSAPTDRVADAMRSEVLRQGLTECEIDGQRWVYDAESETWLAAGGVVDDASHVFTMDNSAGCFTPDRLVRIIVEGEEPREVRVRQWGRTEPDGPLHAPGSFLPLGSRSIGETWARTAGTDAYWPEPVAPHVDESLNPDAASDMSECRNDSDIPTRPWWRRIWSRRPPTLLPPSPTDGSTR